jgi:hypothetical protein
MDVPVLPYQEGDSNSHCSLQFGQVVEEPFTGDLTWTTSCKGRHTFPWAVEKAFSILGFDTNFS